MPKQVDAWGGRSQRAVAGAILAALVVFGTACGPGPGNGASPPTGDAAISITVVGSGAVEADGIDFSCRGECTLFVDEGAEVALSAVPDAQHVWVAWDGPCGALDEQCVWQASDGDTVTMTFARHALRFDLTGDGEGFFQISDGSTVTECREACGLPIASPRLVAITHFPEGSARTTLDTWPDLCEAVTTRYCQVAVRGAVTVPMTWRHPPLAVDDAYVVNQDTLLDVPAVAVDPDDPDSPAGVLANDEDTPGDPLRATVATEPEHGSLDLDPDGAFRYQPEPGFSGVDGFTYVVTDAFGNEDVGTVTITVRPRLTLEKDGRGSGTVTSDPAGIDCDEACLIDGMHVDAGTSVELTAEPADGSLFEWSGACSGIDEVTCTVVVERATSVTARFMLAPRTLTVGIDGAGSGRVTSDPDGIDLNEGEASSTFEAGIEVTLTAEPAVGSTFTGWTGACEDQGPTCTITIDDDTTTTITATFTEVDTGDAADGTAAAVSTWR